MTEQIPIATLHPTIRMLSDEQIQAIHNTSLDILSRTGIVMKNEAACKLLLDAGAWESEGPSTGSGRSSGQRRIKIPPHLVMDADRDTGPDKASHAASRQADANRRPPALTSPRVLRELLAAHGLRPRKRLGQHFLIDHNILDIMVAALE